MHSIPLKSISVSKYVLLFLIALLLGLYFNAFLKLDDVSHLGMSALYFLAVGKLILERRESLTFETSILSSALGLILIGLILWQAISQNYSDIFWRMMPLISAFALSLIASKFNSLLYWKELLILFFLGAPKLIISAVYDPSALTAKAAAITLWYTGFDSHVVKDIYVMLPTGGIKVYEACSGLETVCYTLGLAIVLLMLYPVSGRLLQWSIPIVAILIGFFVNLVRVVLLAILHAWQYKDAFVYWHERDGSLIFGMIAVLLLGTFHYFLPQAADA